MKRRTSQPSSRPTGRGARLRDPRMLAVVVLAVVGATVGVASTQRPAPVKAAALKTADVAITDSSLVCPQAGGASKTGAARIAYANADPSPESLASSRVTTTPVGSGGPTAVKTQAGRAWVVDGPATKGPVRVDLHGPITTSSSVVQFTREQVGSTLQVAATPCEGPTSDAWFGGLSSGVGEHATLLLTNIDSVPAAVNVAVYGDADPPNTDVAHGLIVAPNSQATVKLDALEPGYTNLTAHITTSSGRVVPAIRYDAANGSIPLGQEWAPRTNPPALTQTVVGFAAGDGGRRLAITNPGDLDATVSITLVTDQGSFTPVGDDAVVVPAGGVTGVDLADDLQKAAAAVVVKSSTPIVASGVVTLPADKQGGTDLSFAAAAPALSGPATVASGEVGPGRSTTLLFSAPADDARLSVTVVGAAADSSSVTTPVVVRGGTTVALDVSTLSKDPAPGIALTSVSGGPLFAAWALRESVGNGRDITSFPVLATPTILSQAPVTSKLLAGVAGGLSAPASAAPKSSPPASAPASATESSAPDSEAPDGGDFGGDFGGDGSGDGSDSGDFESPPPSSSQPSP